MGGSLKIHAILYGPGAPTLTSSVQCEGREWSVAETPSHQYQLWSHTTFGNRFAETSSPPLLITLPN